MNNRLASKVAIAKDLATAWNAYNKPEHVRNWNFAHESWQCTHAENNLAIGGSFKYRMEAKDGSFGFDFEGVYDEIVENKSIKYTLLDERKVDVFFKSNNGKTEVEVLFEAEKENPEEIQQQGWQAILDNYAKYVESL